MPASDYSFYTKINVFKIHTCNSVPKSEPRRGSAIEVGFSASANSARLTSTSPRILDRDVPCYFHEYGERRLTSVISKLFVLPVLFFYRNQHLNLKEYWERQSETKIRIKQFLEHTMVTTSLYSLSSYVLVRGS